MYRVLSLRTYQAAPIWAAAFSSPAYEADICGSLNKQSHITPTNMVQHYGRYPPVAIAVNLAGEDMLLANQAHNCPYCRLIMTCEGAGLHPQDRVRG